MQTLTPAKITGQRILLRIECNLPLQDGIIQDDSRLRDSLPTIHYLLQHGAKQIILLGHQGRPTEITENLRLAPHAARLTELIGQTVLKLDNISQTVPPTSAPLVLLENLRFYPAETSTDPKKRLAFAHTLASFADFYVNDAFGTCHRAHASVYELPFLLPHATGLSLAAEIQALTPLLQNYQTPLTLIAGGAKIDTKIEMLENYLGKADHILIGGALANTFLAAQGHSIGSSLSEPDQIITAQAILAQAKQTQTQIHLPSDVVIAPNLTTTPRTTPLAAIHPHEKIFDLGPQTVANFSNIISESKTIIWNGPLGLFENPSYTHATQSVAQAISSSSSYSVLGGGDTLSALRQLGFPTTSFSHVSTAGGALIEFLAGHTLPGIAALA